MICRIICASGSTQVPISRPSIIQLLSAASLRCRSTSFLRTSGMGLMNKIREDIEERDYRDMHRETSPLKQAEDAVAVDTSDMTKEEVVERIIALCSRGAS